MVLYLFLGRRQAIETSITSYAENFYTQGVSSIFSLSLPISNTSQVIPVKEETEIPSNKSADTEPVVNTTEGAEELVHTEEPASEATVLVQQTQTSIPEVELEPEPTEKKFGIYIVGNKYNPSNFWYGIIRLAESSHLKFSL